MKILAFTKKENMTNDGQRKKSWPTKKFLATSKKKSSPRLGAAVFDLAKKGSIIQGHNKKNENLGRHKKRWQIMESVKNLGQLKKILAKKIKKSSSSAGRRRFWSQLPFAWSAPSEPPSSPALFLFLGFGWNLEEKNWEQGVQ